MDELGSLQSWKWPLWGAGQVIFCSVFHSRNQAGWETLCPFVLVSQRHSVLSPWTSPTVIFIRWIPVLPLCFAPLTQQFHPPPNHLATLSAPWKPVIQLMNAQFVWARQESIIVRCALDLHKNGLTLPKGVDITSEWSPTHMSSLVVALLVGPFKHWGPSVRSSVLSIWVIAAGPLPRKCLRMIWNHRKQ